MRSIATTSCAWSQYNTAAAKVAAAPQQQRKALAESIALPARVALVANATAMMRSLQATLSTPGELGTCVFVCACTCVRRLACLAFDQLVVVA